MFRISKFCAILLIFSAVGELFAQTPPDSKEMIKAGAETLQKLNSVGAKWNCILELPSGAEAHIETLQKGTLRLRKISLNQGLVNVVLATIIERDGYWFVEQEKSRRKYLPYEAPLDFPSKPVLNHTLSMSQRASLNRFWLPTDFGAT